MRRFSSVSGWSPHVAYTTDGYKTCLHLLIFSLFLPTLFRIAVSACLENQGFYCFVYGTSAVKRLARATLSDETEDPQNYQHFFV